MIILEKCYIIKKKSQRYRSTDWAILLRAHSTHCPQSVRMTHIRPYRRLAVCETVKERRAHIFPSWVPSCLFYSNSELLSANSFTITAINIARYSSRFLCVQDQMWRWILHCVWVLREVIRTGRRKFSIFHDQLYRTKCAQCARFLIGLAIYFHGRPKNAVSR